MPRRRSHARAGRSRLALAALRLAEAGHPVVPLHTPTASGGCSCGAPCGRVGKHPRDGLGLRRASADLVRVAAWWRAEPQANIGMRCDGLVVLDLDGPEGERSLERLQADLGELPESRVQLSGHGSHRLYAVPAEQALSQSAFALGYPPGVDIRAGKRGYIVAAPSRHASGHRYRWLDPETPIAPLPASWRERLRRPSQSFSLPASLNGDETSAYGRVALRCELSKIRHAPEGRRNETLNRSVFKLAQLAAGGEIVLGELIASARNCALVAGLGELETKATIRSAVSAGLLQPRSRKSK
jgi:Bifunctional DNA primase/polymerase, N-terminal